MSHLSALIASLGRDDPDFSVGRRPGGGRSSAVLALISEEGNDIVLTRRPLSLRHHAGQVALPGGRAENTDETIVDTALREAHEEVGLDRRLVTVRGVLPTAHVAASGSDVTCGDSLPMFRRCARSRRMVPAVGSGAHGGDSGRIFRGSTSAGGDDAERHSLRCGFRALMATS